MSVEATPVPPARPQPVPNCDRTSVGFVPLTDLGTGTYQGFTGGLYPNGSNQPPAAYAREGAAYAQKVLPRNQQGQPDPEGTVALLSFGMSNTTMEYRAFKQRADADPRKHPRLSIVDGAVGGAHAGRIKEPEAPYWSTVAERLDAAGVSAAQVQAGWLKQAIAGESRPFPADAQGLQEALRLIVAIIRQRFPNLQLLYLSSRIYAGYASTPLNPEPAAYDGGFAVKWLIEERMAGKIGGPWLGWGPYLWTDGLKGRSDGLIWTCEDVAPDGTHPSIPTGANKVGQLLLDFFSTDALAKDWFLRAE